MINKLMITIVLFVSFYGKIQSQTNKPYDALSAFTYEKQEGFPISDAEIKILSDIYAAFDKQIILPEKPSKEQALNACLQMNQILSTDFKITYGITMLLSEGLKNNILDCNFYSILFSTYLKSKKHRAEVIITPGHMFLRWYYNGNEYFNYETTACKEYTDDDYIKDFFISKTAINNNLYMQPLNHSQVLACAYLDMSTKYEGNTIKQKALLNKSLKLFPQLVMAMGNLAYCAVLEGKTEEAITMLNKAIKLDSLNYVTYQQAGKIYQKAKKYKEAIHYFTYGIKRNPDDPQSYIYRSNCYLDMNNVDAAMDDFEKGASLLKTNDIYKFLFDYVSYQALEDRIMDVYLQNNKQ